MKKIASRIALAVTILATPSLVLAGDAKASDEKKEEKKDEKKSEKKTEKKTEKKSEKKAESAGW